MESQRHNLGSEEEYEEETVYVLLDFPDDEPLPPAGTAISLQGMHTAQPRLEWPGGTVLLGSYEETVGTQLLFSDAVSDDGSHQVELVAQNRNRVVFRKSTAKPGLGVTSVGWQRIPLPRTSPDKRRKPKQQRRQQQQVQEESPPPQQQQEQQQQQHTNHSNETQSQQPQKGQHSQQQQLQQKQ